VGFHQDDFISHTRNRVDLQKAELKIADEAEKNGQSKLNHR